MMMSVAAAPRAPRAREDLNNEEQMIPSIHITRYGTRAGRRVILTRPIVVYDGQRSALLPEGSSLTLSIDDAADAIRRGLARDPLAPQTDPSVQRLGEELN